MKKKKKDSEKTIFHLKKGVTQDAALKILKQKSLEYGVCILKTKKDIKKDDVRLFMSGNWMPYPKEIIKALIKVLKIYASIMSEDEQDEILKFLEDGLKEKKKKKKK